MITIARVSTNKGTGKTRNLNALWKTGKLGEFDIFLKKTGNLAVYHKMYK